MGQDVSDSPLIQTVVIDIPSQEGKVQPTCELGSQIPPLEADESSDSSEVLSVASTTSGDVDSENDERLVHRVLWNESTAKYHRPSEDSKVEVFCGRVKPEAASALSRDELRSYILRRPSASCCEICFPLGARKTLQH